MSKLLLASPIAAILLVLAQNAMADPTTQPRAIPDEVLSAIEQNHRSHERVKNIAYDFVIISKNTDQPKPVEQRGHVKLQSDTGFEFAEFDRVSTDDKGNPTDEHITSFIGKVSSARWMNQSAPEQFLHTDVHSMSENAKHAHSVAGAPKAERFAFGDEMSFFKQLIEQPSMNKWYTWGGDEIRLNDDPLFRLTMYFTTDDKRIPSITFDLDPKRGFLVQRMEFREPISQSLIRDFEEEIVDADGHGHWYPSKIVRHNYGPKNIDNSIMEFDVKNIVINPSFEDSDFSLDSLKLPEGTRLIQFSAAGNRSVLVKSPNGFEVLPGSSR